MTNTLLIKRSSVPGSVPAAGNLELGELALNYQDGNLFYKNSSNAVTVLASNQFVSVSGNVTAGNIVTGGLISATGNVTGGNVSSAALISGVTASLSGNVTGGNLLTAGQMSAGGNVTGGNVLTAGIVSATGNITANYFIGNGSLLTGISGGGGGGGSSISNGTSNVNIATSGGNVTTSVAGTANVVVVTGTGASVAGTVSASGNITGNYFLGNGSQLTGIPGNVTTSATPPVSPNQGDWWISNVTGTMYVYFNDGDSSQWAEMEASQSFTEGTTAGRSIVFAMVFGR